jgi:isopentenyldiphosphate isomerase
MEFFDIVDENGIPTGKTVSRDEAHRSGIPHRTAHVWIIDRSAPHIRVLLQKRSDNKDSFPGCWDTSSAGHIMAGDEPLPSALRELNEELGIQAESSMLKPAGSFHIRFTEYFHDQIFDDNEIAFVFVYEEPVLIEKLKLQKEEVSAAAWFDLDEVYQRVKENDPLICADIGGLNCLLSYLKNETHQ